MIIGHYSSHIAGQGGVQAYLRSIAIAQRDAGHTVYYLSKHGKESCLDGISIVQADTEAALYTVAKRLKLDVLHLHAPVYTIPPTDVAAVRTIHGHSVYCPSGSKFFARKACPCDRAYNIAGCLWGHFANRCGSIRPENLLQNFQGVQREKQALSDILCLTNSAFVREQMLALGYSEDLVQTLYLGVPKVESTTAPPQDDPPRFLFVGRLDPTKGLIWLIKALSRVKVPVQLEIAGDGNQALELRSLVQSLGLSDRVTFHGWLPSEAVNTLMQSSRALIFPSLWHEPAGLVAYEAMMNARTVIASRVGGIPEGVIEGVTGLLVEPNDITGLVQSIEQLATDWTLAKRMGETGRDFVIDTFGMQHHMVQLMKHYEQALRLNCLSLKN